MLDRDIDPASIGDCKMTLFEDGSSNSNRCEVRAGERVLRSEERDLELELLVKELLALLRGERDLDCEPRSLIGEVAGTRGVLRGDLGLDAGPESTALRARGERDREVELEAGKVVVRDRGD